MEIRTIYILTHNKVYKWNIINSVRESWKVKRVTRKCARLPSIGLVQHESIRTADVVDVRETCIRYPQNCPRPCVTIALLLAVTFWNGKGIRQLRRVSELIPLISYTYNYNLCTRPAMVFAGNFFCFFKIDTSEQKFQCFRYVYIVNIPRILNVLYDVDNRFHII